MIAAVGRQFAFEGAVRQEWRAVGAGDGRKHHNKSVRIFKPFLDGCPEKIHVNEEHYLGINARRRHLFVKLVKHHYIIIGRKHLAAFFALAVLVHTVGKPEMHHLGKGLILAIIDDSVCNSVPHLGIRVA